MGKSSWAEHVVEGVRFKRSQESQRLASGQLVNRVHDCGQRWLLGREVGPDIEDQRLGLRGRHGQTLTVLGPDSLDCDQSFPNKRIVHPSNSARLIAISASLRQSRLFGPLASADLESVSQVCVVRSLDKGETLFREGAKAEGFYVMQRGAVSIYRLTPDGKEQIICIFHPPDSFGEATLATLEAYPANAVALEPSQVILISKTGFRELIRKNPDMSLHMLGAMSLHLRHLVESLQSMKGRQIEQRLAEWFLRQSPGAGHNCPAEIVLPVTKKVLAGQLGVTSETLSRTLARFRQENLLTVNGARIQILDARGLRAYADA